MIILPDLFEPFFGAKNWYVLVLLRQHLE
jgi:hypothetical protein